MRILLRLPCSSIHQPMLQLDLSLSQPVNPTPLRTNLDSTHRILETPIPLLLPKPSIFLPPRNKLHYKTPLLHNPLNDHTPQDSAVSTKYHLSPPLPLTNFLSHYLSIFIAPDHPTPFSTHALSVIYLCIVSASSMHPDLSIFRNACEFYTPVFLTELIYQRSLISLSVRSFCHKGLASVARIMRRI